MGDALVDYMLWEWFRLGLAIYKSSASGLVSL